MTMYDVNVDRENREVFTVWGDTITDESVLEYQRAVWSDPSVQGYNELLDFRQVLDPQVTGAGLKVLAKEAADMNGSVGYGRTAVVVREPYPFGMARMYESYRANREGSQRQVRVFMELDAAVEWLRTG